MTKKNEKIDDEIKTILVVEDEETLLKFTSVVLKKTGYNVLEASSGDEAVKISLEHRGPIHLMLTDVIMPGMSGKELFSEVSKRRPEMKILYTSGYPNDVVTRHGIIDDTENLLQKPTTVEKLQAKVKEAFET